MKRAIQWGLETQISKSIFQGDFREGDTVLVEVENERLAFKRLPAEVATV